MILSEEFSSSSSDNKQEGSSRKVKKTARERDFQVKYKTEICKNWESGYCSFGSSCAFAHGSNELRQKPAANNNHKNKVCKHFHDLGYCMYGTRCQFLHKQNTKCKKRLPIFEELTSKGDINGKKFMLIPTN